MIRRGFTLIELLVVTAILAILAGFLFPVFSQARESARQSTCLSNQKQIGNAVLLYAQDHDDVLMPERAALPWNADGSLVSWEVRLRGSWVNNVQSYLRSGENMGDHPPAGVMACRSFSQERLGEALDAADCWGEGGTDGWFPPHQYLAHYSVAYYFQGGSGDWPTDPLYNWPGSGFDWSTGNPPLMRTVSLAAVVAPARNAHLSDGFTATVREAGDWKMQVDLGCAGANSHREGCNLWFLDGHARYVKGNPERYIDRGADGRYYRRYFAYDR
jgi:prepilin-type N-terminal cleavage/methylation domain-containing protein/prepilin-type processing-associated H-X9-DG protein